MRWFSLGMLAGFLVYLIFAIPFWLAKPVIAKRYASDFNRVISETQESDLAWPLLRRAKYLTTTWDEKAFPNEPPVETSWEDPNLEGCRNHVARHAEAIDLIVRASERKRLGHFLTNQPDPGDEKEMTLPDRLSTRALPYDSTQNPLVMTMPQPWLGPTKRFTRLLGLDMDVAAVDGDSEKVLRTFEALMRLSQLVSEPPNLVGALTGLAIRISAVTRLTSIHARYPELLTRLQRERAAAVIDESRSKNSVLSMEWERIAMLDLSQRVFSDFGNGNGYLTWDGWDAMLVAGQTKWSNGTMFFLGPVAARWWGTRDQFERATAVVYDAAEREATVEPWQRSGEWLKQIREQWSVATTSARLPLGLAAAVGKAIASNSIANFELEVASAVLRHESLDSGVNLPTDVHNGLPIQIRTVGDQKILYSVGPDRDDDGGTADVGESEARRWLSPPQLGSLSSDARKKIDGDWRLWPPKTVRWADGTQHPLQIRREPR